MKLRWSYVLLMSGLTCRVYCDGVSIAPFEIGISLGAKQTGTHALGGEPVQKMVYMRARLMTPYRDLPTNQEQKTDLKEGGAAPSRPKPRKRLTAESRVTTEEVIAPGSTTQKVNPHIELTSNTLLGRFAAEMRVLFRKEDYSQMNHQKGRVKVRVDTASAVVSLVREKEVEVGTLEFLMNEAAQRIGVLPVDRERLQELFGSEFDIEIEASL